MRKRPLNQQQQQSGGAQRHAVNVHYSDACECRNCRRLRRKREIGGQDVSMASVSLNGSGAHS